MIFLMLIYSLYIILFHFKLINVLEDVYWNGEVAKHISVLLKAQLFETSGLLTGSSSLSVLQKALKAVPELSIALNSDVKVFNLIGRHFVAKCWLKCFPIYEKKLICK